MRFLWDANLAIARVYPEHPFGEAALRWTAENPDFAICPLAEGALIRHALRSSANGIEIATNGLGMLRGLPGYKFWPDDLSYADAPLHRVQGHKQVTDAYLVALAAAHGGRFATFDRALAATHPEAVLVR